MLKYKSCTYHRAFAFDWPEVLLASFASIEPHLGKLHNRKLPSLDTAENKLSLVDYLCCNIKTAKQIKKSLNNLLM